MPWELACPACRAPLTPTGAGIRSCPDCAIDYRRDGSIWHLLVPEREQAFQEFVARYEATRSAEGREVRDPDHLRALPFRDLSGKRRYEWFMRRRSFRALMEHVILPLERLDGGRLRVLDLGSGLGWLAYRLAQRGHKVLAVDLLTNDADGLGAHVRYDRPFLAVQAEFDRLPLPDQSVDMAIYNASFHYSADFAVSLREAFRVLAPRGRVIIMDSPLYRDGESGAAMVREREDAFGREHGFGGPAGARAIGDPRDSARQTVLRGGYLTYDRLRTLEREVGVRWTMMQPWYGVRWWLKPQIARLLGRREPARFKLIVGERSVEP